MYYNFMYALWVKLSFGVKFLKLVQFVFCYVMYLLRYSGTNWQVKQKPVPKTLNHGYIYTTTNEFMHSPQ